MIRYSMIVYEGLWMFVIAKWLTADLDDYFEEVEIPDEVIVEKSNSYKIAESGISPTLVYNEYLCKEKDLLTS